MTLNALSTIVSDVFQSTRQMFAALQVTNAVKFQFSFLNDKTLFDQIICENQLKIRLRQPRIRRESSVWKVDPVNRAP